MERFRVEETIGSGGMGTVYRAFDERLQRAVAIKEIRTAGADRVLREAQAAARLNHPSIVTLYELGERDGHALLVSELVHGKTLDRSARDGEVSDRDIARIGRDLCDALAHAHSRGVVHRDVKPQNAIVRPHGAQGRRAKLMDFGIATVAGAQSLTADGEVVGTLAYMAPEQAEGEYAGPEADVYSLALTLYEAWTGENPVARRTPAQTARQIGAPVPSLAGEREDLPARLVDRIDACLEADPHERPTVKELRSTLDRAIGELDDDCAVPSPDPDTVVLGERSLPRVLGLVGAGIALAALAAPAARPGLAIALAVVALPALAIATRPVGALVPFAAVPLGAIGALAVLPALAGLAGRRPAERAALGAIGFAAYVMGAIAYGAGPRLGIAPRAPESWGDTVAGGVDLVATVADPVALAGMGIIAVASLALGFVMRAHPAIALVGAVLWAAALAAALELLGNGAAGGGAAIALVAVGAALAARGIGFSRPPSSGLRGMSAPSGA